MPVQAAVGTIETVFLAAVLLSGYLVCFALWWFFFRGR